MINGKDIELLKDFNKWRRGDEDIIMPNSKELGECIDRITEALDSLTLSSRIIDSFEFSKFLSDNYEYFDNTHAGDVYKHKSEHGLYSQKEIFEDWLNSR